MMATTIRATVMAITTMISTTINTITPSMMGIMTKGKCFFFCM